MDDNLDPAPIDDHDDVEGHRLAPTRDDAAMTDADDDVEGHRFATGSN